jgi:hypothetical protein
MVINSMYISKEIKSMLITNQDFKNMHLWKKTTENQGNSKDLWKYGSILTIQKSLVGVRLSFLNENFHINIYYCMLHHILSCYIKFWLKTKWKFFTILINWLVHVFEFQRFIVKGGCKNMSKKKLHKFL